MTNEEAKAIISNEYKCVDRDCDIERSCGKCDLMMPNKEPILKAYKLAIKALEQTTWIPVSERLPEENADILVAFVDREETRIIPVNYGRGTWFDCIFNATLDPLKITAWMPLPKPYKGE